MNATLATPSADLHLRTYDRVRAPDRHDFAQLVLPLDGRLVLEVEGRQGVLDPLRAAFIAPRAWHSQVGEAANRSLIVDLEIDSLAPAAAERLLERPFPPLGAAARKLVEFMGIMAAAGERQPALLQGWLPLLLDTLALEAPRQASRLSALLARVDAEPGLPWTTGSMAAAAGVSVSRLHALFREELGTSPHAWLLGLRLACARALLAQSTLPIAAIALRAGFSEQSALTRAMRQAGDLAPAAFRHRARQNKEETVSR